MIKKEDVIVLYLSAILAFTQYCWMKAERRAAYAEGKLSAIQWLTVDDNGEGVHKAVPKGEKW